VGAGRAAVVAALALLAVADPAPAQVFFASRPHPEFEVGPLFVRARVDPALGPTPVDLLWSLVVPPMRSGAALEQDLCLLWPGEVVPEPDLGPTDPALVRTVEEAGMAVIAEGRVRLRARNLYRRGDDEGGLDEAIPGGAPFVSFIREGGGLGISAPATWVRIPWDPRLVNRVYMVALTLTTRGVVKPKPATWAERTFWGERHRLTLSFGDVRARAMFPLYFRYRDRALRLSEDPSQLVAAFSQADRLRIEEMTPPAARRQRSETLENTEVVSVFLDRGEGLRPQTLTVQFGYFWGLQSWAPVLFAVLFFTLGNLAGPLLRGLFTWVVRTAGARLHFGRRDEVRPRSTGVVLPPETLARIVPGQTTHEQVLAICGRHPEEHERLGDPAWKSLVYRGRRAVPRRRRTFGWLSTVDGWDVEHHEVEIELHRGVVRDIQARVRRTHPARPDAG
jgi:hypothetical protein